MHIQSTHSEKNTIHDWSQFSHIPDDDPVLNTTGADPLGKLLRTLYALAFLIMLLLVLSARMLPVNALNRHSGITVDRELDSRQGQTNGSQQDISDTPLSFLVNSTTDANDGICDGHCSLREALTVAGQSRREALITFDSATFAGLNTITLTHGELSIPSGCKVTIEAPATSQLNISGNYQSRVFHVARGADLTLRNLSVVKGKVFDEYYGLGGGGFYNQGTLSLISCTVADNSTSVTNNFGGGIYNDGGRLLVSRSRITGNSATGEIGKSGGGGIYNQSGIVVIRESILSKNKVTGRSTNGGAGIYCRFGSLEITQSTLSDNTVSGGKEGNYGGGIYIERGWAVLSRCTLSGNTVRGDNETFGGGIYNFGSLELSDTIFSTNSAEGKERNRGGGIYHSNGILTLIRCSLMRNRVEGGHLENFGGGIYSFAEKVSMGATTMYGNTASLAKSDMDGKMEPMEENQISSLSGIILIRKSFVSRVNNTL